ncbi:unnamed protein product [Brassica oleracea]
MRWSKQTWVIATFLGKALTFFIFSEKRSLCYYKSFVCRSPEQVSGSSIKVREDTREEEASSLSFTPQDLLDSSRSSVVYHGVCDANSVVEGGRGEATEPSNSYDDRRNTSEVAPLKEVVSFGKRHRLTNNYRSVVLGKPHASHRVNKEAGHAAYKKDVETTIKHYSTAIEIDDEEISLITNRHAIHLKMESISFHIFFGVQFVNQDGDEAVAQEDEMVEEA